MAFDFTTASALARPSAARSWKPFWTWAVMSFRALAKQVIWLVMVVSFVRESEPRHAERGGSRRTPMAGSSVHAAPQHGHIIRNPRTRSSPIVQCTIRVVIDTVVEFNVLGSASEVSEPFTNTRLLAAASLVKLPGWGVVLVRRVSLLG